MTSEESEKVPRARGARRRAQPVVENEDERRTFSSIRFDDPSHAPCPSCIASIAVLAAVACRARNRSGLNASAGRSTSAGTSLRARTPLASSSAAASPSSASGCTTPSTGGTGSSMAAAEASASEATAARGGLISHAPPRCGVQAGLRAVRAEKEVDRALIEVSCARRRAS